MFSEELQKLIDAALVDGVITDKERATIRKKALLEGVDPDEVDVLLDAEIQKIRQDQEKAVKKVKKCPNCGEVIPALAASCPSCGYEFRDIAANSSSKELADKLQEVEIAYQDKVAKLKQEKLRYGTEKEGSTDDDLSDLRDEEKATVIRTFPIPNTKEDLFEFAVTMKSNMNISSDSYKLNAAYEVKLKECLSKAHLLFPDDSRFQTITANYNKEKREEARNVIIVGVVLIVLVLIMLMIGSIL